MKTKRTFLAFGLASTCMALHAETIPPQNSNEDCPHCEYDKTCCTQNPSSWGMLTATGEFLYWQPVLTGMAYVVTRTTQSVPAIGNTFPDHLSVQNVKFDYGPGYRLGIRYTLPKTSWDIALDYTQFTQSGDASVKAAGATTLDTLWDAISAINASQASADLEVKLKLLNAKLGKTIPFLHCFAMRPNFGIQFFKLNNIEDIHYQGVTSIESVNQNSNSYVQLMNLTKGWGLIVGFDALWRLPQHFEFFGQAAYGVLNTRFTFTQNQQVAIETLDDINLSSTSHFSEIIQDVQVKGGVNWNYSFNCKSHPMALKLFAAYEQNVWIQGVQLTRTISLGTGFSDAVTTNIGNLSLRGLTSGASLSF